MAENHRERKKGYTGCKDMTWTVLALDKIKTDYHKDGDEQST
jgi:hypothetical protein